MLDTSDDLLYVTISVKLDKISDEDHLVRELNAEIINATRDAVNEYRAWVSRPVEG